MNVKDLIDEIRSMSNCSVDEPTGFDIDLVLPEDLSIFYKLCNGITLFEGSPYSFTVVKKENIVRANPVIVGEPCEYDISFDWHIIAMGNNEQYITIDLNSDRLGKCYDSFWETYGLRGQTPIIAMNFTELLDQLLRSQGQSLFWLNDDFVGLGDAYDGIPEDQS